MLYENPYKAIEMQIENQLAIAIQSDEWVSKVSSPSLDSILCKNMKNSALERVRNLLKKLPQNYHILPKLTKIYYELNKK